MASLLCTGFSASAQNAYMSLSVGLSSWNFSCTGTTSCDNRAPGMKFLGGYNLSDNLSIEGGYFSMSRTSATFSPSKKSEYKANGFEVAAVGRLPMDDRWGLYAKLGLSAGRGTWYNINPMTKTQASSTSNSVQPLFGLGATYKLNERLQARAEWDLRKVEIPGSKPQLNNFSLGVQYHF